MVQSFFRWCPQVSVQVYSSTMSANSDLDDGQHLPSPHSLPMPPRRDRLRTRSGCDKCRQRRKKCDERRPSCGACQRLNFVCVWGNANGRQTPAQPNASKIEPPAGSKMPTVSSILSYANSMKDILTSADIPNKRVPANTSIDALHLPLPSKNRSGQAAPHPTGGVSTLTFPRQTSSAPIQAGLDISFLRPQSTIVPVLVDREVEKVLPGLLSRSVRQDASIQNVADVESHVDESKSLVDEVNLQSNLIQHLVLTWLFMLGARKHEKSTTEMLSESHLQIFRTVTRLICQVTTVDRHVNSLQLHHHILLKQRFFELMEIVEEDLAIRLPTSGQSAADIFVVATQCRRYQTWFTATPFHARFGPFHEILKSILR